LSKTTAIDKEPFFKTVGKNNPLLILYSVTLNLPQD